MVMTVYLQGGTLCLQYFRDTDRQLEEAKVRERREFKGQGDESDSHVPSVGSVHRYPVCLYLRLINSRFVCCQEVTHIQSVVLT